MNKKIIGTIGVVAVIAIVIGSGIILCKKNVEPDEIDHDDEDFPDIDNFECDQDREENE